MRSRDLLNRASLHAQGSILPERGDRNCCGMCGVSYPWSSAWAATVGPFCIQAAAAVPATPGPVLSEWISYIGCDSLFAAAADSFAARFGGHERWSMNSNNCDAKGGIVAPGMDGMNPATGNLMLNSQGNALYTRFPWLGGRRDARHPGGPVDRQRQLPGQSDVRRSQWPRAAVPAALGQLSRRRGDDGSISTQLGRLNLVVRRSTATRQLTA